VDPGLITQILQELIQDVEVAAVHIGMLGTEPVARAVCGVSGAGEAAPCCPGPDFKVQLGSGPAGCGGTRLLIERLVPLAEVITPNLDEAATLTGLPVANLNQMREAAARLHSLGAANVVITGGDLGKATDLLSFTTSRGVEQETFKADRLKSTSTHGTGCAFATALACHLAHDRGLPEAVLLSKAYVSAAIVNAHPMGHGTGPLHHLYRMNQQRRPITAVPEADTAHSRN